MQFAEFGYWSFEVKTQPDIIKRAFKNGKFEIQYISQLVEKPQLLALLR